MISLVVVHRSAAKEVAAKHGAVRRRLSGPFRKRTTKKARSYRRFSIESGADCTGSGSGVSDSAASRPSACCNSPDWYI